MAACSADARRADNRTLSPTSTVISLCLLRVGLVRIVGTLRLDRTYGAALVTLALARYARHRPLVRARDGNACNGSWTGKSARERALCARGQPSELSRSLRPRPSVAHARKLRRQGGTGAEVEHGSAVAANGV